MGGEDGNKKRRLGRKKISRVRRGMEVRRACVEILAMLRADVIASDENFNRAYKTRDYLQDTGTASESELPDSFHTFLRYIVHN